MDRMNKSEFPEIGYNLFEMGYLHQWSAVIKVFVDDTPQHIAGLFYDMQYGMP